jgi:hypothetical protein
VIEWLLSPSDVRAYAERHPSDTASMIASVFKCSVEEVRARSARAEDQKLFRGRARRDFGLERSASARGSAGDGGRRALTGHQSDV